RSASQEISVTRFETEYKPNTLFIYGEGTEAGGDPSGATPMRAHTDQDGNYTGVFDVYTTLTPGGTFYLRDRAVATSRLYGGADGTLEPCATTGIATPETGGQYRVTVDLNNNTYAFLHIDRWSLVGDAVEGGWGGDVPLAYKG